MKWNIFVGTLVLGLGLCTQSFGFDLLDRMLGGSGCGCDGGAKSCCTAGPSCAAPAGCAAKPSCGCDTAPRCCAKKSCDPCGAKRCCHRNSCCKSPCDKGCANKGCANKGCAAPAPTCEAKAPTCAAAAPTCEAKAPSCGCEKAACNKCNKCQPVCRKGLLDRLFSCKSCCSKPSCCDKGCANKGCAAPAPTCAAPAPTCGCEGGKAPVKAEGDATPNPPAPVVDPSAFLPTQRRVVHASTSLVR